MFRKALGTYSVIAASLFTIGMLTSSGLEKAG